MRRSREPTAKRSGWAIAKQVHKARSPLVSFLLRAHLCVHLVVAFNLCAICLVQLQIGVSAFLGDAGRHDDSRLHTDPLEQNSGAHPLQRGGVFGGSQGEDARWQCASNSSCSATSGAPSCIHFLTDFSASPRTHAGTVPAKYAHFLSKWRELNPDHCIAVQTPASIESLLVAEGGQASKLLDLFLSYRHGIQRCDLARYVLMLYSGGVYSDMDIEVKAGLEGLAGKHPSAKVFLGVERVVPEEFAQAMAAHHVRRGRPEHAVRVANYWMASRVRRHPFWRHVLSLAEERASVRVREHYDVIYTTGPDLLTEAFHSFNNTGGEVVLLERGEFRDLLTHHSDGYWKSASLRTSWVTQIKKAAIFVYMTRGFSSIAVLLSVLLALKCAVWCCEHNALGLIKLLGFSLYAARLQLAGSQARKGAMMRSAPL